MQYFGGKSAIAKEIAPIIASAGGFVWEPFCGGLSVTRELARLGCDVLASDVNPSLIALYRSDPYDLPDRITEREYQAARLLPDDNPLKAFIGYGCSFGARYFAGYARKRYARKPGVISPEANFAAIAKKALAAKLVDCKNVEFLHADFNAINPFSCNWTIYCDPPYANTTQGHGVMFDTAAFYRNCAQWSRNGATVFISEYAEPPIDCNLVWQKEVQPIIMRKYGQKRQEKLWRVEVE